MSPSAQSAAFHFAPNAYQTDQPQLVGRQMASLGLLRAAIAARADGPVIGYGIPQHGEAFAAVVRDLDADAPSRWLFSERPESLAQVGVCYRPDPRISQEARMRLRGGPGRYSLCGVFHTTAHAMEDIAATLHEPLTSWDAIVCPSASVRETVRRVQDAEADYLRWRLGAGVAIEGPQFPVIPLGVHCADFDISAEERATARAAMGVGPDDVVALYVGRLSLTVKAHPAPMFAGLQAAVTRTGRKVTLIQCGYFSHPSQEAVYARTAAELAPAVRSLVVDGRIPDRRRACWAAADLFVSLSDNIQETFGLTPLEAMAAGLPVVVTDWDGYRETVRDGIDGFRIRTWAPVAGMGDHLSQAREAGSLPLDMFCWAAAASTSLDRQELADRLSALVEDPELRRSMGEAGRARARSEFDWRLIFGRYRELWDELTARRLAASADPDQAARLAAAPRRTGAQLDPFVAFGHYPTAHLAAATRASLTEGSTYELYLRISALPSFPMDPAPRQWVAPLWPALERGPVTPSEAAGVIGCDLRQALLTLGALAKMGLVRLSADS